MEIVDNEATIDGALTFYFEQLDRGKKLDASGLIAKFPNCAEELQKFFADERLLNDRLQLISSQSGRSNRLSIRCPNCHHPTKVPIDTEFTDLTCESCGSRFNLIDQTHATAGAIPLLTVGRFELVERLGMGAFGTVWKARDKELDRTVALKIPRQGAMSPEEQEKFFREARAAAQLSHPNIVSVHEVGRDGNSIYIVSDFVRGLTLADWLTGQQPSSREAAECCAKIAEALHHAHEKGVVHRDLKPANIMLDAELAPHIMDFGLARREMGEVSLTVDGHVLGTPAYMSPEQAQGKAHTADRRSDVYSLGVILFQLLTGELPFRSNSRMLLQQVIHDDPPSLRTLVGNIKRDLETITLKCLEKSPERRYGTTKQVADELRRFLRSEPIEARPVGRVERFWRWSRRNPRIASLTASVAMLLIAIAGLSLWGLAIAKQQQFAAEQSARREANLRELSERNLGMAEQAVDDYLTRVADDDRLKEGDFHKLRTELLETAVPFYEQFAKAKPEDVRSQANQANAYARLATIHNATGQQQQSRGEYERAIIIETELLSKHPENQQLSHDLARQHTDLGWNLHVIGDYARAKPHYEAAISILTDLLGKEGKNAGFRRTLAQTRERLGLLLSHSDAEAAQSQYERAIAITDSLVANFPDDAEDQSQLASAHFRLGFLMKETKPKPAREELSKAADIQRKLVAAYPKNPEYRCALAESVGYLGSALLKMGENRAALHQYEEAIDIQAKVAAYFPSVVKYRDTLGSLRWTYWQLLAYVGDTDRFAIVFEENLAFYEQLVTDYPENPSYQSKCAYLRMYRSNSLMQKGDNEGARATLLGAAELMEKVPAGFRDAVSDSVRLGLYSNLANVSAYMGDEPAARKYAAQAVDSMEQLLAQHPTSAFYMNALAKFLATSADASSRNGKRAIELAKQACELTGYKNPVQMETLAAAYAETGDFKSAMQWAEKGLELVGEKGNSEVRTEFSRAVARYRDGKPARALEETSDSGMKRTGFNSK